MSLSDPRPWQDDAYEIGPATDGVRFRPGTTAFDESEQVFHFPAAAGVASQHNPAKCTRLSVEARRDSMQVLVTGGANIKARVRA